MIVSIKLNIAEGSVYTEELSNFLGTQAALMQSGVVIDRAPNGRSSSYGWPTRVRIWARRWSSKSRCCPRPPFSSCRPPAAIAEYTQVVLAGVHGGIHRPEEGDADADIRHDGGGPDGRGHAKLQKDLRKADEDLAAFQSTNSVVLSQDQGNKRGQLPGGAQPAAGAQKSEYELLAVADGGSKPGPPAGTRTGRLPLSKRLRRDRSAGGRRRRERTPITSRPNSNCCCLQAEQEEMGRYLRTNHPKMIAMSEEIARREQLLKIFRMQSAEQLESKKASLALEIQNLEKDVKEWDGKMLDIQAKTAEYQRLKGNSQRIQALYDRLLATMQTLDVNKEISPESVTIMETASPAFRDQTRAVQADRDRQPGGTGAGRAAAAVRGPAG